MTETRSDIGETRKIGWSHIRLSIVVPIGVIVAVAIVCVVVAVLSSARRADEVALDAERQLFTRALANHGERVLREIESVSTSEAANRRIRVAFDREWVQTYVGLRLQSFFEHDFVFIADASDRFIYASLGSSQRRSELVQHDPAGRAGRSRYRAQALRVRRGRPRSLRHATFGPAPRRAFAELSRPPRHRRRR